MHSCAISFANATSYILKLFNYFQTLLKVFFITVYTINIALLIYEIVIYLKLINNFSYYV